MKKYHVRIIIFAIAALLLLWFVPIIPIGKVCIFVNLSNGEEIIVNNYFFELFSTEKKRKTQLTQFWPKNIKILDTARVLITEAEIFPFSKKYIDHKKAKLYFDLKSKALNWKSSDKDKTQEIIDVIHRLYLVNS